MTISPPSGSEAFGRLHPNVQRWIWRQGWRRLRAAQEAAIAPVLAGTGDVLIAAPTASGKTEAAFLPICSALVDAEPGPGFAAVYISPLKALINDQYGRLDELCAHLDLPVARWHGDVGAAAKKNLVSRPRGILLITPESLEALFVLRGSTMPGLMGSVRHIVVDELHSFMGTARGAQLQSLMHRLDLAARRRIPRIGLSATLGDMRTAADFLRPGGGAEVVTIMSDSDGHRGAPLRDAPGPPQPGLRQLARGRRVLHRPARPPIRGVRATSRQPVEGPPRTRRIPAQRPVAPGHRDLHLDPGDGRRHRLGDLRGPAGRATRRRGPAPAPRPLRPPRRTGGVTRVRQRARDHTRHPPHHELRAGLVQAIATVELLLQRWYEPPQASALHMSTLVQQVLSLIAQHGGITPADAYRALCAGGPFRAVDAATFMTLLRDLGDGDLIRQENDGLLLHGEAGERLVNHHTFYAAFAAPAEYRIVHGGRTLGGIPMEHLLPEGALLIFAGRRWRITAIDTHAKLIEVAPASGGTPPRFTGSGPDVHDRVRTEMRRVYEDAAMPAYLDATAQRLLTEGRRAYRRMGLATGPLLGHGGDTLLFPFRGDVVMTTLALALHSRGIAVERHGLALALGDITPEAAGEVLGDLTDLPDAVDLAALVPDKRLDKHDALLGDHLLTRSYAARRIDVPATREAVRDLVSSRPERATGICPP